MSLPPMPPAAPPGPDLPSSAASARRGGRRMLLAGLGLSGVAAVVGGFSQRERITEELQPRPPVAREQAFCADPGALVTRTHIGGARLVYEVDGRPRAMQFDEGFHRQLEAWFADFNRTSRYRGATEIWSHGAHVDKDGCRSWHAAGRGFDISRLRSGSTLLVSAREDLWQDLAPARRAVLARRYWTLGASLNLHFAYVLSHHFDDLHRNHFHVDNGVSGAGMSRFDKGSRVQNQSIQEICRTIWGRQTEVTGEYEDSRRVLGSVLDELGLGPLTRQENWQAFLRASVRRG